MWTNQLTWIYFMKMVLILLKKKMNFWQKKLSPFIKNYHPQFIIPPHISYKNMASFSYNIDDLPPVPSNESFCQLTSAYISMKPRERNYKVVSFSNMVNPLLFEKNMFVCASKAYMFPLQSNDIFKSDTGSPVLSCKSFVCTTSGPSQHVRLLSLLLLYVTVKTYIIVLFIVILSVSLVLVNLYTLLLVQLLVL